MYIFSDKKGRSLTLRPENTAPVMRAYIENGLHRKAGISRFFYLGPMFRYDRPQAGRYRQFHQFGVEALGSSNPAIDAEIIKISLDIYGIFGFEGLEVRLNSVGCPKCRPSFTDLLREKLVGSKEELCADCAERAVINPLRIFDCKECVDIKQRLPVITDHLCDECSGHFSELQGILNDLEIDFVLDPLLVRGLDYYTKTAYEIIMPGPGSQNALCGGGRYDGLAADCGGGDIPAIGFSAGMERLLENLPPDVSASLAEEGRDCYIVVPAMEAASVAMKLAGDMRSSGLTVEVDLSGRSLKKQLKGAVDSKARHAVFVGPDEIEKGKAAVKDLGTGEQRDVSFTEIVSWFTEKRGS